MERAKQYLLPGVAAIVLIVLLIVRNCGEADAPKAPAQGDVTAAPKAAPERGDAKPEARETKSGETKSGETKPEPESPPAAGDTAP